MSDVLFRNACTSLGFGYKEIKDRMEKEPRACILDLLFEHSDNPEENSRMAGSIAMKQHYDNCPLTIKEYASMFKEHLSAYVYDFMMNYHEILDAAIKERRSNDFLMDYFAASVFINTYSSKLDGDTPRETPQMCWMRVAIGEYADEGLTKVLYMYDQYSQRKFIPASPTIFNMGFNKGSHSSCMIYTIADSMESILKTVYEAGIASKNSSGLGIDLSNLRHSKIGRQGMSKGILPLMKILDDLADYCNQGGKRPGAITASLRVHHIDIMDFIRATDRVGEDKNKVTRLNTSVVLCDLFMERCAALGKWTVFCPKYTPKLKDAHGEEFNKAYVEYENSCEGIPHKVYDAMDIMNAICEMQIRSGMPYIVHGCNTNRKNNMDNVGPVRSTNLCQEITIPAVEDSETGCCNLSSINLSVFVVDKKVDYIGLAQAVRDCTECLNKVVDKPQGLSKKAARSNAKHRPIGIGVSGFADMVYKLDIPPVAPIQNPGYTQKDLLLREVNPELAKLNHKIWSCMYYNALYMSCILATKHGRYSSFDTSHTAKGILQHHLWKQEAEKTGRSYSQALDPLEPSEWGQEGSWAELIEAIKKHGLRNSLLLTCMPTASTAQLLGNVESTEFPMQAIYTRKVLSGDYPVINFHLVSDMKARGLWTRDVFNQIIKDNGSVLGLPDSPDMRYIKDKYLTMWEIPQKIIVDLAAQRQVFIDHSQSMNLYISRPTVSKLCAIHEYTWKSGLKTGLYYLRSRGSNDALKIGQVCTRSSDCISCQ